MRCRLQILTCSYIADTHFNTEKERICIFNDETNQTEGKTKFWFKKHYNGIGSPTSFSWRFFRLQENKAASIEFTQINNCSICKIKLIHNKAISSINCLQILREISRCPQANAYRTLSYENSEVGLDFPEDREHFLCTQTP